LSKSPAAEAATALAIAGVSHGGPVGMRQDHAAALRRRCASRSATTRCTCSSTPARPRWWSRTIPRKRCSWPMAGCARARSSSRGRRTSSTRGRTSRAHFCLGAADTEPGPPEGEAGRLHFHARAPGGFLLPEGDVLGVRLDPAQAFVFPDPGPK